MRKIFYFAMMAVSLCLIASCQGKPGMPGRDGAPGRDGKDGTGIAAVKLLDVDAWQYSDDFNNNYFYAMFDVDELTPEAFDNGLVKMYRTFNWDSATDAYQIEMPYTRHKEACVDVENDKWAFWTETVDYAFGPGWVTVYYTASDFDYELDLEFVPEAMSFRLVVME